MLSSLRQSKPLSSNCCTGQNSPWILEPASNHLALLCAVSANKEEFYNSLTAEQKKLFDKLGSTSAQARKRTQDEGAPTAAATEGVNAPPTKKVKLSLKGYNTNKTAAKDADKGSEDDHKSGSDKQQQQQQEALKPTAPTPTPTQETFTGPPGKHTYYLGT